ncbi:MAG: nucleotide sugar dehydrogenase [Micavibrio sp.]|nr:nucleotide sugar dehydrogenase [Micavibrio sp.]
MTYNLKNMKIAVVGLGYVGMPLAVALAKYGSVVGYDVNKTRVADLKEGWDSNREIRQAMLRASTCEFTDKLDDIKSADIYIVTVPTPIDEQNNPDLDIVEKASTAIGGVLDNGNIIVYESTVYPGVTEDICGSILEKVSGLKSGEDFFLGYSPERINPGDEVHTVENITKVVAGQTDEVAELLVELYGQMNGGNIYKARDIKTAEASKAIENAQRDINIAFMNEVTMLLNKMGLSSYDVIDAARSKWNFLPFTPGLVGGHCIGVDPYYLAKSALDIGHQPEVILSGRKINDGMGAYVADRIDRFLNRERQCDHNAERDEANILILGFTFKENINDVRNTKVVDVINTLKGYGYNVDVHDPHAREEEVSHEYGLDILTTLPRQKNYDCVMLAVNHKTYSEMTVSSILSLLGAKQEHVKPVIYDIKGTWKTLDFPDSVIYETL